MPTWLLPAIAVAAILAWLGRAFVTDRRANRQRLCGNSRLIETRRGPIEYAEAGSGPAVLVMHGAGGGFDQGMEFAEPIAKRGFRVVAMSRFGYLRTAMPVDASSAAQADAHLALMDASRFGHPQRCPHRPLARPLQSRKDCRPHARRERTRRSLRDLCQRPIHCPTHSGRPICRLRQWWSLVGWAR
jgi:hypothetical protein